MKIIGLIGSRTRTSNEDFDLMFDAFKTTYKDGDWICSGGCPQGGDNFAELIARKMGIPILIFHADWERYGKGAGFKRNGNIAQKSSVLISLGNRNGKGGAEDTCDKFIKSNNGFDGDLLVI